MAEWVGLGAGQQQSDFANTLTRVAQLKAAQLQGQAAQSDIDGNNRLTGLIAGPEFAARLANNDPTALAARAARGSRGLGIALPLMHQARQPNQTRQVEMGGQTVTQEFDPQTRQWREIGRGPRWQPQQAQAPVVVVGPDGKPMYVSPGQAYGRPAYVPSDNRPQVVPPGSTLVGPGGQPVYTSPERPQQAPSGFRWGPPDENGNPTMVPVTGGPGEYFPPQQMTTPDGSMVWAVVPRPSAQQPAAAPQAPAGAPAAPPAPPAQPGTEVAPPAAPAQPQAGSAAPAPTAQSLGLPPGSHVISSGPGRQAGLTEAQAKANLYGLQMRDANAILDQVQIPSAPFQAAWRNLPEGVVNPILNANDQQYFNALRLFAAGVLRKETGAAFTPNELLDVQSRFFPMPGDSAQVIAQKRHARITALSGIQAELPGQQFREVGQGAGPGGRGTASPPPPGASRGTGGATMRWNPETNQVEPIR